MECEYAEYYGSNEVVPYYYLNASPACQFITLNPNGTISGNMQAFESLPNDKVEQQDQIRFYSSTTGIKEKLFRFSIDTADQRLTFHFLDVICREGCGYIFEYKK